MALIKCTECGHTVSDKAVKCPKCGTPIQKIREDAQTHSLVQNMQVEQPKTVQEPQKEENLFVSSSGKMYRMDGSQLQKKKINVWVVIVCTVLFLVLVGAIAVAVTTSKDEIIDDTPIIISRPMEREYFNVEKFIRDYYTAVENGDYLSYFEYDDITFFDLEHVDREAIKKRMSHTSKYPTSREYDWATLETETLPSGAVRAVYSCDYYIHYQTRTDKYRIRSEMVISPRQKIQSIKDLETVKVGSY